jgi:hypothetical protein
MLISIIRGELREASRGIEADAEGGMPITR